MFMQMVFSKVHPACHKIANGIKPGSDSRKIDKNAVHCSKAVWWSVKWSIILPAKSRSDVMFCLQSYGTYISCQD